MDRIAILIPCWNEAPTIAKVIGDFRRCCPEGVIYVYDNNSDDGTAQIAEKAGAVVRRERQQGKGNVIRRMFREVDALCYILVDGDDTYPAESAREMARLVLEDDADMVVGDRLTSTYREQNKRAFHSFGNSLIRSSINWLFQSDIRDVMTGYRAFSYEFVKTFPVLSKGFEIETEMTIHAVDKNLSIRNLVIAYRDRPSGSVSKLNTVSDGRKVIGMVLSLFRTYSPLRFFGAAALLLALLSVGFFIPVFASYLHTGLVPNLPTLVVCGFTMIAGIQSLFTGLQLQTVLHKNRQDFEMRYIVANARKRELSAGGKTG